VGGRGEQQAQRAQRAQQEQQEQRKQRKQQEGALQSVFSVLARTVMVKPGGVGGLMAT
jgi:hypothetical protein